MPRIAGIAKLNHPVLGRRSDHADANDIACRNTNQQTTFKLARELRVPLFVLFIQDNRNAPSISIRDYLTNGRYGEQRLSLIECEVWCILMARPRSNLNRREILQDRNARIAGLEISQRSSEGCEKYGERYD
jgi:hypothetical protein